jgi:hypothetical protein
MPYDLDAARIAWILADPNSKVVSPLGIQVQHCRVVGQFDLAWANVPFPLGFRKCRLVNGIKADNAHLQTLDLSGSTIGTSEGKSVNAEGAQVAGDLDLAGVHSKGTVELSGAHIGRDLDAQAASFENAGGIALDAERAKIDGSVLFRNGFRSTGTMKLDGAEIGNDLDAQEGIFEERAGSALIADGATIKGDVNFGHKFHSTGEVQLLNAKITGNVNGAGGTFEENHKEGQKCEKGESLDMSGSNIKGYVLLGGDKDEDTISFSGDLHLDGATIERDLIIDEASCLKNDSRIIGHQMTVNGAFKWQKLDAQCTKTIELDLTDSKVGGALYDDGLPSWPALGKLNLDGFVYSRFAAGPADAKGREDWLARLPVSDGRGDFASQPYQQLANVLRESGDDSGAKDVLVTMENERWWHGKMGFAARCWSFVLWLTIGYGYKTWRALWFAFAFVASGTFLFYWGRQAGAIVPANKDPTGTNVFNPFIYSLELFLPLVDLQQVKHWMPDASRHSDTLPPVHLTPFTPSVKSGRLFGSDFGRHLRWYLWLHVLAGWFFTSMIIASVTGLVHK